MAELNRKMVDLGQHRSAIRDVFEYGRKRAEEIGRDNLFDFSLGNPNAPAPKALGEEIVRLVAEEDPVALHGYTSAQGDPKTRQAIAENLRDRFGIRAGKDDLYLTCGAAASLAIVLKALICPGKQEEVILFAPFFPEYRVFAEAADAVVTVVPAETENFGVPFAELEQRISDKTKAVIVNLPNNPTGVVWPLKTVRALCELLDKRSKEYGHPIYLLSDEPYRELVYDPKKALPFLTEVYRNTIVCYSFSKSLSIPGERLGYIFIHPDVEDHGGIYAAVCGAGRSMGYVCAPSLMQKAVQAVLGESPDLDLYRVNRYLLLSALSSYGFRCIPPDGAFYLFMESPEPDAEAFCRRARDYEILLVPSDSFGVGGFVRLSYCVRTETVRRSLPAFRKLAESYGLPVRT